MRHGVFLLILFSTLLQVAFAQPVERVRDIPVAVADLYNEPIVATLSIDELMGRRQRRAWAPDDLEGEALAQNFGDWLTCYSSVNEGNSTPDSCRCNATGEPMTSGMDIFGLRSCIPEVADRDLAFSKALSDELKQARDTQICQCVRQRNSIEYILGSGFLTDAQRRDAEKQALDNQKARTKEEKLIRAFGENLGPAITVMNYARSDEEGENLAGIYLGRTRLRKSDRETLASIVENNDNLTDEQCVPQREFIFHKQFPTDPTFYEDLNRPFVPDDWNYSILAERLRTHQDVASIPAGSEAMRIKTRMEFLINNPAFKALFMSNHRDSGPNKAELHRRLKSYLPRPDCRGASCIRTPAWRRQISEFQENISEFLGDRDVNDNILNGVEIGRDLSARSLGAVPTSDVLMSNPFTATYTDWITFCATKDATPAPIPRNRNPILRELENAVDFTNIAENPEFIEMNTAYCTAPRRSFLGSSPMNFTTFRETSCRSITRRTCIARFVTAYPLGTDSNSKTSFDMNTLLADENIIAQSRRGASANIANISSSPTARSRSFRSLSEIPSESRTGQPVVAASTAAAAKAPSQDNNQNSTQQNLASSTSFSPIIPDVASGAAASTRETQSTRLQELRENNNEEQSRLAALNEEIAGLRNEITEKRNANAQDPNLAALNTRYSFLEEQYRRAQQQLTESRQREEQLAQAQSARGDEDDEENESSGPSRSRRIAGGISRDAQSAASAASSVQDSSASAPLIAPVSAGGGGASLSSGSSSTRSRSSSAGASVANAPGVVSSGNGDSGNGAITISNPSADEYAQIRAQAAGNQIVDSLTPEILSQINNGDTSFLNQYRQRIDAFSGRYVLLNLQVNGEPIEFVVEKNGTILSLASRNGRFIASEPVADPSAETIRLQRENTLEDLNNKLRN